jgi:hypothetical protein
MSRSYDVVFLVGLLSFIMVGGFWAWATSDYILSSGKLPLLPPDQRPAMKDKVDLLGKIVTNNVILGAIATSAGTAIFGLLKNMH